MKPITVSTLCAFYLIVFAACQKEAPLLDLDKNVFKNNSKITDLELLDLAKHNRIDSLAAQLTEMYTLDVSQKIGQLTTRRGVKLTVNPNDLRFKNGVGVNLSQPIQVLIKQAHKTSEMIVFDKPTNTEGGYLESYGEFYVALFANNQPLELRENASIRLETPVFSKNTPRLMPIWDADTTLRQIREGLNPQAQTVTAEHAYTIDQGSMWRRDTTTKARLNANNYLEFEINKLNTWKNCDVFYTDPRPKTTLLVHFNQHYTPSVKNDEWSAVYFKPTGRNTLIKLFRPILNATNNKQGFHSDVNTLPIGMQGSLIALTRLNNRWFATKKDIQIAANANGFMAINNNLEEMSEQQFLLLLKGLDN